VQEPPRIRSTFPCGVSRPSYATEPTTTKDIETIVMQVGLCIFAGV
jgi:hypothetical protein